MTRDVNIWDLVECGIVIPYGDCEEIIFGVKHSRHRALMIRAFRNTDFTKVVIE